MRRGLLPAAAAAALLLPGAGGCGLDSSIDVQPQVSIARGFFLEVWIIGQENYAVLYQVNGDRKLGWGGGADAVNRTLSWSGLLTEQEYERLQASMRRHGWFEGRIQETGEPPKRVTRIHVRSPGGGTRHYRIKGRSPDIEPVADLLDAASRRRLEPELQMLPGPSEPPPE